MASTVYKTLNLYSSRWKFREYGCGGRGKGGGRERERGRRDMREGVRMNETIAAILTSPNTQCYTK